jgi:DNA polymerase III psi subunit
MRESETHEYAVMIEGAPADAAMKAVLRHIDFQQSRFAEHPFFDELERGHTLEQMLAFAPRLAFWVMAFQDVLRLNAQRVRDPELAPLMHRHRSEERDHDRWFFEDVSQLAERPLTLNTLWGHAHDSTRDASYALVSEVLRPLDDRLRMVLVLTLESTSHVFFERSSRLTQALGHDQQLKYFSTHHVEAEEQHELFEEELEARLRGMVLPPELCAEAFALVDRIYAAFHAMFHGLRSEQQPRPEVAWTPAPEVPQGPCS